MATNRESRRGRQILGYIDAEEETTQVEGRPLKHGAARGLLDMLGVPHGKYVLELHEQPGGFDVKVVTEGENMRFPAEYWRPAGHDWSATNAGDTSVKPAGVSAIVRYPVTRKPGPEGHEDAEALYVPFILKWKDGRKLVAVHRSRSGLLTLAGPGGHMLRADPETLCLLGEYSCTRFEDIFTEVFRGREYCRSSSGYRVHIFNSKETMLVRAEELSACGDGLGRLRAAEDISDIGRVLTTEDLLWGARRGFLQCALFLSRELAGAWSILDIYPEFEEFMLS